MSQPETTPIPHHNARSTVNGSFVRTPETAERDRRACELRRDGNTFDAIALQLGYAHRSEARKAVQRGLLAIVQEPAEELRALELERLDLLWSKTLEVLTRTHYLAQNGKIVRRFLGVDDETDEPVFEDVLDPAPLLKAVEVLLKVQERRAKLVGLDSPKKIELLTVDLIDAEIQRLRASMDSTAGLAAEYGLPYAEVMDQ